jgi:SSS family solute:Na+ symporter
VSLALALALYAVAVLLVGAAAARKASRSEEAFLAADRGLGPFVSWAALSSTVIGGSTTLVLGAMVAASGIAALWLDLAGALGLLALGLFLAGPVRRTGAVTIGEVIGRCYGSRVRRLAAVLVVLSEVVWFALLVEATETVVTASTDWPARPVLLATVAVFVAYTALGGQRAVVATDVLQLAIMAAGLLGVAFPLAVRTLAAGPPLPDRLLSLPFAPRLGPVDALGLLVLVGLPHLVGSDVWAKVLSARDERSARIAALGAAGSKLAFGLGVATIALAGVSLGIGGPPQALLPKTVLALAGPALAPLLLVSLVATMQSSADSVLLSAAAATSHDILPGVPGAGRARLLVVAFGAFGLAVALGLRDLVETFRLGYTLFASSLILPTLAALLLPGRIAPGWAGGAMVTGAVTALAARWAHATQASFASQAPLAPFPPLASLAHLDPVLAGTGACAAVLLLGLGFSPASGTPTERRLTPGLPPSPRPPAR